MQRIIVLCSIVLLLVPFAALAQEIDYCEGNFDCDQDVDGSDASMFKSDFGRSSFSNACPSCTIDLPKTGQTTSYATGDDGALEMGFEPVPNPRFTDNNNGTVTDNLTELIWLKDANCLRATRTWSDALDVCNGLQAPDCGIGYPDPDDWRLPNLFELESLIDRGNWAPVLPSGHPFINVLQSYYWSSTSFAGNAILAWYVQMGFGIVSADPKTNTYNVWCVRGGH